MENYAIKWARELEQMQKAGGAHYYVKRHGPRAVRFELAVGVALVSVLVALFIFI